MVLFKESASIKELTKMEQSNTAKNIFKIFDSVIKHLTFLNI